MNLKLLLTLAVIIIKHTTLVGQVTDCEYARKIYLEQNPDVAKAGMDPYDHYNRFGIREGRKWPKCKDINQKSNEDLKVDIREDLKIEVNYSTLNNQASFMSYGEVPASISDKCNYLMQEYLKYDSLSKLTSKYKSYFYFENQRINVNDVTSMSVRYYKSKKILYIKAGQWEKHKESLIKFGFDPQRLQTSHKLCKLYFALDPKENKYMEVPYFELNELYIQKLNMNQFNRQYYNCNYLKSSFNKFLKKNPDIFEEVSENEVSMILYKLTNIDDFDTYAYLSKGIDNLNTTIYNFENKYKVSLNDNYFYWGEKKNSLAHGTGFLARKNNNNILATANWEEGFPLSIWKYYFYKENKGYYIKGKDKVLHIIESPNNTNSQFYFGNYLKNYQNYDWVRHGIGEYIWSDGHYLGNWKYGERTGYGTYIANLGQENQTRFEGEFFNGNLNGYGKKFDNNGKLLLEGLWVKGNFSKTKAQLETEQREEAERQRIAAEKAALLTSGNFDQQLEKGFNEMMGTAILKKSLGQNINTEELLKLQVTKLESEVLMHPMSSDEKKYFAAFYEKKMSVVSKGLDMLNTLNRNSSVSNSRTNSENPKKSDDRNKEYVYICTAGKSSECCRAVVVTQGLKPQGSGCCPRSDGKGCSSGHGWSKIGESGTQNWLCSYCSISVRLKSWPENSGCCPVKGCIGHSWSEIK